MTTIQREICLLLYVNTAYFIPRDLEHLYCAYPSDGYGLLVYVEDVEDHLPFLSAGARAILDIAHAHKIGWLRLMPDIDVFQECPLPTPSRLPAS